MCSSLLALSSPIYLMQTKTSQLFFTSFGKLKYILRFYFKELFYYCYYYDVLKKSMNLIHKQKKNIQLYSTLPIRYSNYSAGFGGSLGTDQYYCTCSTITLCGLCKWIVRNSRTESVFQSFPYFTTKLFTYFTEKWNHKKLQRKIKL